MNCAVCQKEFSPKRPHGKFCSPSCNSLFRTSAYRKANSLPVIKRRKYDCKRYAKCDECGAPRTQSCRNEDDRPKKPCTGRHLLNPQRCASCPAATIGKKKYCVECRRLKHNKRRRDYYHKRKKQDDLPTA